ncbi:rCG64462, partial [Rattus norvegicus]
ADWITSQETWVSVTEGRSVSLLCRYNISAAYYVVLYWFRQYPNKAPEYILHRGWGNPERGVAEFALERFYSKSTANSIDLQIKNLIPADSALYLC